MENKKVYNKLTVTFIIFLYALAIYFSPISCVILELTGMKCPGCGMTRALIAALQFDFKSAFSFHKMFWSIPVLYISFLKDGNLFKNKLLNFIFHFIILIGFIMNWLF